MAPRDDVFQELQETLESRTLELEYERTCNQVEAVCESERSRLLRVRILLLEEENDRKQSQLIEDNDQIESLKRRSKGFQDSFEACSNKFESARSDLRAKARESETLKAELDSLHGVTMDSTKLLTDKLTFARELSSLRPELDHLRSQAASYQTALSEKLALQRQLNTIQVELETEKRSTQRALAKEDKQQAEDAKSESRLESLQAEIAKERRDRLKVERESQKTNTESEIKIATLESRSEAFRHKLKTTKDQLKLTQTALETAQAAVKVSSKRTIIPQHQNISLAKSPRKRVAAAMDTDTMIGTPGDLPVGKKNKRGASLVGEKSTFSITPFLNRTASVAPEIPLLDAAEGEAEREVDAPNEESEAEPVPSGSTLVESAAQGSKVRILDDTRSSRMNPKKPPARKSKAVSNLEQVIEEAHVADRGVTVDSGVILDSPLDQSIEIQRKRRRVLGGGLGKTIFDEDDGDAVKSAGGTLSGIRGFGMLGKGGLEGPKFGSRKILGAGMGTFGAISPRKQR